MSDDARRMSASNTATRMTRRTLLRSGAGVAGGMGLSLFGGALAVPVAHAGGADDFGPLQPPDSNGLRLPPGFSSRVVAETGMPVPGTGHSWHPNPDGGATFVAGPGGWIYVSNSETTASGGGVGAIRFSASGAIVDAYSILSGTTRNCAGGPTPWGTWLSCEEVNGGEVWECDPYTPGSPGWVRPALGRFNHEAAAVDPTHSQVYLTEDQIDGLLYRFTPDYYPSLDSGVMEVAEILGAGAIQPGVARKLAWHVVPEPSPSGGGVQSSTHNPIEARATRYQVTSATQFNGGEGCWYRGGWVFFATKGDNRVWQLDTVNNEISILYDLATSSTPVLANVDNVFGASTGDVYVAEDPGDLQIVALTPTGGVKPIVQVTGQSGTEICGPALSPDGTRLYFSSQRNPGRTYEVLGPFVPPKLVPTLGALGSGVLAGGLAAAAAWSLGKRARISRDGDE